MQGTQRGNVPSIHCRLTGTPSTHASTCNVVEGCSCRDVILYGPAGGRGGRIHELEEEGGGWMDELKEEPPFNHISSQDGHSLHHRVPVLTLLGLVAAANTFHSAPLIKLLQLTLNPPDHTYITHWYRALWNSLASPL